MMRDPERLGTLMRGVVRAIRCDDVMRAATRDALRDSLGDSRCDEHGDARYAAASIARRLPLSFGVEFLRGVA